MRIHKVLRRSALGVANSIGGNAVLYAFAVLVAIPASAGQGTPNFISLVSHGYSKRSGWHADNFSRDTSASADGRFVAFVSRATNLVPGDTNNRDDVFVYDRETNEMTRVSVSSSGMQSSSGVTGYPSISADGRFVAFESSAPEFHSQERNDTMDIFVHDRKLATTTRVSVSSSGEAANRECQRPSISGDGRFVAFDSGATNLVLGDTNGHVDVFVRDLQNGTTIRVPELPGNLETDGTSWYASISFDGRQVAFDSFARNLTPNDHNGWPDVFVTDVITGKTTCVSVSLTSSVGNGYSRDAKISGNGRFVSFISDSTDLVPNDTNATWDIFVRDLVNGTTTRESVSSNGGQGNGWSGSGTISHDGRFVAFQSRADNFAQLGQFGWAYHLFIRDRELGTTKLVTKGIHSDGGAGNANSFAPVICASGAMIAFSSRATNLTAFDINGFEDVFVFDPGQR